MSIDTLSTKVTPPDYDTRADELDARWGRSLLHMQHALYPDVIATDNPQDILAEESQRNFTRQPDARLIIGLAGPGAAGKGTIGSYLTDTLAYAKIVNTTTRPPRAGERDGIDYHFTDPTNFTLAQAMGKFALSLERINRGMYGIAHEEIERKLSIAPTGCILEENPENIMNLFSRLDTSVAQMVLLYVMPPQPIAKNSLVRLADRLSCENDPQKKLLTPDVFESTLGDRQIDEFHSLAHLPDHPAITPLFIVNDNLNDTKTQLTTLFGGAYATTNQSNT